MPTRTLSALERRARAWALHLAGRTQREIAAELHVSQQAVSKMLAHNERDLRDDLKGKIETRKARQVEFLEHVAREGFRAWEKSKEPRTSKRLRTKGQGGLTERQDAQITTSESPGDPRFLDVVRGALSDERKVLGLDAPVRVTATVDRPLEGMPDEQLDAELRELALKLGLTVESE